MKQPKAKSELEETLHLHVRLHKLPSPKLEHCFHPVRKWRLDFAWPYHMVAAECEGGTYIQGRHTRGQGHERDCEKYNAATELGWEVYRFTIKMIKSGYAIKMIETALARKTTREGQMFELVSK